MGSVRETVELLGYLCEEDDGVPRRVWQQGFVAVNHECGEGGGEQPGLDAKDVVVGGQCPVHKRQDDKVKTENTAYENECSIRARFP